MKKNWVKCLSFMTVIAVITTFFTPFAHAQAQTDEEKRTNELAEALEFIYEKAAVKDSSGEIVGIDVEMVEEEYGDDLDENYLDDLKSNLQQNSNSGKASELNNVSPAMIMPPTDVECMQDRWKEFGNGFVPASVLNMIYSHLADGEYWSAAKKMLKTGFKGSMVGLATELTMSWVACK